MKRLITVLLVLALMLSVAACSKKKASTDGTQDTTAGAQATTTESTGEMTEREGPSDLDLATDCVGQEVQVLFDAIGYPVKMEYFDSPMNEGEDVEMQEGVFTYEGFVVYTLKEGAMETVLYVE